MIIKGSTRAGPKQLARHLLRADTNERVEVLELQSPLEDLTEAFRDWQTLASGTRGSKGLYHANIDPDARYKMTPDQWQRSVEVLEAELGLTGQPRAIVLHDKNGREHIHVVWQRTDVDTMTMVSDSNNYKAHERASLALEKEFGHEHVPGKHAKRDREKQPEPPKAEVDHAEWQQAERAGVDPRERKEAITALYEQSDTSRAFSAALENDGYMLAKGDRRDYVIVDGQGHVLSLARQINGVTAKDLREFMADLDREAIPSVEEAKARQAAAPAKGHEVGEDHDHRQSPASDPEAERIKKALDDRHHQEQQQLKSAYESERQQLVHVWEREAAEKLAALDRVQQAALARYDREHPESRKGLDGVADAIVEKVNPKQAAEEKWLREHERSEFLKRQEAERRKEVGRLEAGRDGDLEDVKERHLQKLRERAEGHQKELERHLRERAAAERLRAEIEDRRKQHELEEKQRLQRNGPEPPRRVR